MKKEIMKIYQAYGLKAVCNCNPNEFYNIVNLSDQHYSLVDLWERKRIEVPYDSPAYQPLLYPLTQLDRPIKVQGRAISPLLKIKELIDRNKVVTDYAGSWLGNSLLDYFSGKRNSPFPHFLMRIVYRTLYAMHFDLDDQIHKNEAANVLKVKGNPYEQEPLVIPL